MNLDAKLPKRDTACLTVAGIAYLIVGVLAPPGSFAAEAGRLEMDTLVVTANRVEQRRGDVAENVSVVTRVDLRLTAAQTLDDALRQIPGFSLFRRSSSLVANPTSQGVSLRGIGPSGVSRTLVLLDGVPLNDPFGGWVYWSRVPRETVERIEVVRGGGSDLWGNAALGGVIQVFTTDGSVEPIRVTAEGGTQGTWTVDGGVSAASGPFRMSISGRAFSTDGYAVIREGQRGPIDIKASSEHEVVRGSIEVPDSPAGRLRLFGDYFSEVRGNGTRLTGNDTRIGMLGVEWSIETGAGDEIRATVYGQKQTFQSRFSAQEEDRSSERPALDQFDVPTSAVGAGLAWHRTLPSGWSLGAGGDFRWVDGETNERFRNLGDGFTRQRGAGGEQQLAGLYVRLGGEILPGFRLRLGLRADSWQSSDLWRFERSLEDGSVVRDEHFADPDELAISPKLSLVWRVTPSLSLRGAGYRSFRSPTLNELVRPFRVRNDITEANETLDPETLWGGEVGADFGHERWLLRLTGFWNQLEDPISNVTIATGPGTVEPCGFVPDGGVCRQRQNLDRARVRGVETEFALAPAAPWLLSFSHLLSDAMITAGGGLEGRRIAQVPRNQFVARIVFDDPELLQGSAQIRWLGGQFEDDRNQLRLGSFAVVDLFLGRELVPGLAAFVSVENLLDREVAVGRTGDGLVSIGSPRRVFGGVRLVFS